MEQATLTIGQIAARAGIRTSAIRYYESVGVLPEPERVSGQRRYQAGAVDRLGLVAAAQKVGFDLGEIRDLLDASDAGRASERMQALAARKLPQVEALIEQTESMKRWLELASTCGCSTLDACALFQTGASRVGQI